MNFSFDWGAVAVMLVVAVVSVIVMKNDIKWIVNTINELKGDLAVAHKRIDSILERRQQERSNRSSAA